MMMNVYSILVLRDLLNKTVKIKFHPPATSNIILGNN